MKPTPVCVGGAQRRVCFDGRTNRATSRNALGCPNPSEVSLANTLRPISMPSSRWRWRENDPAANMSLAEESAGAKSSFSNRPSLSTDVARERPRRSRRRHRHDHSSLCKLMSAKTCSSIRASLDTSGDGSVHTKFAIDRAVQLEQLGSDRVAQPHRHVRPFGCRSKRCVQCRCECGRPSDSTSPDGRNPVRQARHGKISVGLQKTFPTTASGRPPIWKVNDEPQSLQKRAVQRAHVCRQNRRPRYNSMR